MKNKQLSFLTDSIKTIIIKNKYDATICNKCICSKCKYNVEITPFLTREECKEVEDSCFNCDECFYYGMDDENLSTDKVKFECAKFEKSNYYEELEAEKRRKNFKIIR